MKSRNVPKRLGRTAGFNAFKQSFNLACHGGAVIHSPRRLNVEKATHIDVSEFREIRGPHELSKTCGGLAECIQGRVECTGTCPPVFPQVAQMPAALELYKGLVKDKHATPAATKDGANRFCKCCGRHIPVETGLYGGFIPRYFRCTFQNS
jgi:hypothetical protein